MTSQSGCTRRDILKRTVGAAAGLAVGMPGWRNAAAQAADGAVRLKPDEARLKTDAAYGEHVMRLADDLFIIRIPGEANVLVRTGADGVLLVDGGSSAASDALMKAVAALPGAGPVRTLFNTHWHPEQTGSNERLGKTGATIVAHENTRLWLTTDVTWPWNGRRFERAPKVAQPNKTFYTTGTIESAGKTSASVEYGYIPDAAHTDGDLYVYFPAPNVLAVGDVVSGEGWPAVDWATGGWIGGMVGGVQRLLALANPETRVVPARGRVLGFEDLKTQAAMYGTIYTRLTQLLNKGRSPSEAVEAQPAREFDSVMGNSDEFVRRSFESLWAYLSPDA